MGYYRGFKAEAERLSVSVREELGLSTYKRLDPHRLADHLSIPVHGIGALADQTHEVAEAVEVLHGPEASSFSAVTVFRGAARTILHNDAHNPGRQASNITHELAHGLLLHPATPMLDSRGCRNWKGDLEDEATFLAGALLVPGKAAWWIAKQRQSFEDAAVQYGCSVEMIRFRINMSGAGRLLVG